MLLFTVSLACLAQATIYAFNHQLGECYNWLSQLKRQNYFLPQALVSWHAVIYNLYAACL